MYAFEKVKSANGSAGVDRESIKDFNAQLGKNLSKLEKELKEKSYSPLPVLRVEIPKPTGGTRLLGIPSVRDRVVQQALLDILQPIFDPDFHVSSYGYRPGRSCHHAITKAQLFIRKYDFNWVVDMDLSKCFDSFDHELMIGFVKNKVVDGSILNLIRKFLKSGAQVGSMIEKTEKGSPQGGVISPLLANIYLDQFDQFSMKCGYRIVRYADDILIFATSRKGAQRRFAQARKFLESNLLLKVNLKKTRVVKCSLGVKYLGVVICLRYTSIDGAKVLKFKSVIKNATRRTLPVNLSKVIKDINPILRGFAYYFRIANCSKLFNHLMGWIRRRLRAIQLAQWKKPAKLHRRLRQMGYSGDFLKIKMQSWRNAGCTLAHMAMPNSWFREKGLFDMSTVATGFSVQK